MAANRKRYDMGTETNNLIVALLTHVLEAVSDPEKRRAASPSGDTLGWESASAVIEGMIRGAAGTGTEQHAVAVEESKPADARRQRRVQRLQTLVDDGAVTLEEAREVIKELDRMDAAKESN